MSSPAGAVRTAVTGSQPAVTHSNWLHDTVKSDIINHKQHSKAEQVQKAIHFCYIAKQQSTWAQTPCWTTLHLEPLKHSGNRDPLPGFTQGPGGCRVQTPQRQISQRLPCTFTTVRMLCGSLQIQSLFKFQQTQEIVAASLQPYKAYCVTYYCALIWWWKISGDCWWGFVGHHIGSVFMISSEVVARHC